jgi:hypothetical protein
MPFASQLPACRWWRWAAHRILGPHEALMCSSVGPALGSILVVVVDA